MHCPEFREAHCAFIDDTLAGVELVQMQEHLGACPVCARFDAQVRRSLMLFKSLPEIELSSEFSARLESRLRECRTIPESGACANFRMVAAVGAMASVAMLAYVGYAFHSKHMPRDIIMPPVVALAQPPIEEIDELPPAFLASVSAGMALWPAAMFADQAPLHLAALHQMGQ